MEGHMANEVDPLSSRDERGRVRLSMIAESLLMSLLGSRYYPIHGAWLKAKKWNKILRRLVEVLERSIDVSLDTDLPHQAEIKRYLYIAKSSLDKKDNTDPEVLLAFLGICFELMGGLPDNRRKVSVNKHPNNYRTDAFRTVHYVRTSAQKVRLIMLSARREDFKQHYSQETCGITTEGTLLNLSDGSEKSIRKHMADFSNHAIHRIGQKTGLPVMASLGHMAI
jgi:hypothetical protein